MIMRFGIIGLGNHAINRVMPAIVTSGNQISAVYSRNLEKARKEGIPYGSDPYDDLDDFFNKGDFESVYIASPNFLHYSQAMKSLENGKNVLLEKQMTLRNEDAAELVSTANRRGLALAVGFHMRFHPAVAEVRNMVRSGDLGKITYIRGTWAGLSQPSSDNPDRQWWSDEDKVGGGSVMGTGVHVLDTINHIMGAWPTRVSALRFPHGKVIDTTECVTMEFSGSMAMAVSSRAIKNPRNDLEISGTKGTVVVHDVFSTSVRAKMELPDGSVKGFESGNMYAEEVKAFVDMANDKDSIIARGRDGEAVVRIVTHSVVSMTLPWGNRGYSGILEGYDVYMNLVIKNAGETIGGETKGVYDRILVRGDNVIFVSPSKGDNQ